MQYKKFPERKLRHLASVPIICGVGVPLVFLDIALEIYHRSCFPLYKIPYIDRSQYIRIDRHRLKYLTLAEKLGCAYCGYANGLLFYASRIAAETENYWCGVRHEKIKNLIKQNHHDEFNFLDFDDQESYVELSEVRAD
jgi:hypothetical protein